MKIHTIILFTLLYAFNATNAVSLIIENKLESPIIMNIDGIDQPTARLSNSMLFDLPTTIKFKKKDSITWHTTGLQDALESIKYEISQNKTMIPTQAILIILPGSTIFTFKYEHKVSFKQYQQPERNITQIISGDASELQLTQELLEHTISPEEYISKYMKLWRAKNYSKMSNFTTDFDRKDKLLHRLYDVMNNANLYTPASALHTILTEK